MKTLPPATLLVAVAAAISIVTLAAQKQVFDALGRTVPGASK